MKAITSALWYYLSPTTKLIRTQLGNEELLLDQCPDIKTLKKLHSILLVHQQMSCHPSLAIQLMRSYAAFGEPGSARNIFDEITDKNVVFFNVMIRSYTNNRCYQDALLVYKSMSRYGIHADNYTYPSVLKACSGSVNLFVGLQIHSAVLKLGLHLNLFIGNGLVSMYGKCGQLIHARRVLDEMIVKDVVSWNSMVAGYAQTKRFDDALNVCKEMEVLNLKPDSGTMASLFPAVSNTKSDNVLYVKNMFMRLSKRSLVSWNVMIAVYMNNSMSAEAVDLYLQMVKEGVEPDAVSFACVLPACGDISNLLIGKQIHEYADRKKLRPNLLLENALIDMYAKCGCLEDARAVFDQMRHHDVVSWTSMISAYGIAGQGQEAVSLFQKMQCAGLKPDSIAFVSVLSACSHAGLLDEGRYFFKLMSDYRVAPRIEHMACMVDLLGRAGKTKEAYDFINSLEIEPNDRVWGALLSACRVHSNMDIGLIAADHLLKLAPQQSGYYVLLSNMYAKAGRWEEVSTVRSMMKSRGIRKTAGVSNYELDGHVHRFLAGEQSGGPESKKMYEELDVLVSKMKELGYAPETDNVLHDVEEEDKEYHLAVHSEKLAIVFALLNTQAGTQIRITKNLRVCADCHTAIKLISKITQREIIVRDTHRFHYFQHGVCSCRDYW